MIGSQRNQGPEKFRVTEDVLLELITVAHHRLACLFPEIPSCLNVKVRFFHGDLERNQALIREEIAIASFPIFSDSLSHSPGKLKTPQP